jgi:hypothetical protein
MIVGFARDLESLPGLLFSEQYFDLRGLKKPD